MVDQHMPSFKHSRWNVVLVLAAVASFVGCQGFSSGKSSQTTQAGQLSVSSSTVTFGNVQMGTSQSKSETVTNSGAASITVTAATVTGAGYSTSSLTMPLTLAAGQSAQFN